MLETEGGVFDFELAQVAPDALQLSVRGDKAAVKRARSALGVYLRKQGLAQVRVSAACGGERLLGRTGKLRRIVSSGCGGAAGLTGRTRRAQLQ